MKLNWDHVNTYDWMKTYTGTIFLVAVEAKFTLYLELHLKLNWFYIKNLSQFVELHLYSYDRIPLLYFSNRFKMMMINFATVWQISNNLNHNDKWGSYESHICTYTFVYLSSSIILVNFNYSYTCIRVYLHRHMLGKLKNTLMHTNLDAYRKHTLLLYK